MSVITEGVMVLVVFGFIGILILQAIDDRKQFECRTINLKEIKKF